MVPGPLRLQSWWWVVGAEVLRHNNKKQNRLRLHLNSESLSVSHVSNSHRLSFKTRLDWTLCREQEMNSLSAGDVF